MKKTMPFIFIIVFAILVVSITPFTGSVKIPISVLKNLDPDVSTESHIFYQIRLPRVFTAFLAGAALACCGVALQAMFKNPLATPFTLGISGGAAFGAAVHILFAASLTFLYDSVVFSFAGSLLAVLLVYGLTRIKKGFSVGTMLLAGVAVNFFFSSLILFLQYISDFTQSFRIIHWLMGSIDVIGYATPAAMLIFTAAGILIIISQSANLNLMSISDEIAISRGVDIRLTRKIIFFATSVMVAGVVAFCGPIGFVGLMAPHICRLLIGCDHKILTPASVLFGGAFLALCDTIARTVIAPAEMPVGVITALLGGPFFVWLLLKDRGKTGA
ncbi:MAG: iron ABC transporter permease [Sedimentisphaerales bacterium]|nr:iron ABC transporter permease [Sedimentisphaerales bacterium]